jgi:hypothetical protein
LFVTVAVRESLFAPAKSAFVVVAVLSLTGCGGGSGGRTDAAPTATPMVATTASPSSTSTPIASARAWAVDGHQIVRSDDGGLTWSAPLFTSMALSLQGIAFVDRQTGWVVGGSQFGFGTALLHTTDGGGTWTSQLENVSGLRTGPGVATEFGFFDVAFTTAQHEVAVGAAEQGGAIFGPPALIVVTEPRLHVPRPTSSGSPA